MFRSGVDCSGPLLKPSKTGCRKNKTKSAVDPADKMNVSEDEVLDDDLEVMARHTKI